VSVLVGVHGIWQQQLGRHQLLATWAPALADGLERACGHAVAPPPLDLAFYGDVFLPPADDGKAILGGDDAWLDDLADDEVTDLVDAAAQILTDSDLHAADHVPPKGYTRVPLALQRILRALDLQFGLGSGVLWLGEVRQVRRYLYSAQIKQEVDARVAQVVVAQTRVLIGHSLGSVVALEYLRQHPDHPVDLLLTLGSPLGLRMIRDRLPDPTYATVTGSPVTAQRWVNIRDLRDPVACAGQLSPWWPVVHDLVVDNQADAHSVQRYLSKQVTGSTVLHAVPTLATA
jgi:hypothetical protein